MTRLPFPKEAEKLSKCVLDLVHTDICGPMNTIAPGGSRYFMTMIDDYSRFTVVYFLQRKSEAAEKIMEYVRMVETRFGKKPAVIRSDQGGEYKSTALGRFYRAEGITPQYTTAYTPQQNGIAERKNRSLVEMARCLVIDAKLGYRYWAEAVNTAVYLQNVLPSRSIPKTPYELWNGRVPDLKHLRMFGSLAYVHIPDQKRTKLEPKAVKMIFIGYSDKHKAYKFIDPDTDKVKISRDVRFLDPASDVIKTPTSNAENIVQYEYSDQTPTESLVEEEKAADDLSEAESTLVEEELNETLETSLKFHSSAEEVPDTPPARISLRATKGRPPVRYEATNAVYKQQPEPRTYDEAVTGPERELWIAAIKDELKSLEENRTWDLAALPKGRKAIGCKWIFKRKEDEQGNVVRYKARLVAQGFTQKFGTDYDEVFAPVVKQVTFKILATIAVQRKLLVKHADVKTAYLNGELQETVYMKQPPGTRSDQQDAVCYLKKSLYGLKQAARVWNNTFDAALKKMSFTQSKNDSCLYFHGRGEERIYLAIYVDDIVVACRTEEEYQKIIRDLNKYFTVTSLGDIRNFLGVEVKRTGKSVSLNQARYIRKLLGRFGMDEAKPSKIPLDPGHLQTKEEKSEMLPNNTQYASLVGGLLYVAVNTRPDIAVSVSILGRKMSCPSQADWEEAKRILRYLKHTVDHELVLGTNGDPLAIYVDADWAGDAKDRKSTSGYLFQLGGGTVYWSSKKQTCVTLSSTEAEYIALAECCQEVQWLLRILEDFCVSVHLPITIFEDNQSCIKQLSSPNVSRRSKHIETKNHYIREMQTDGVIQAVYCPTEEMIADMLTKPLQAVKLRKFREAAGIFPSRRSVEEGDDEEEDKVTYDCFNNY